MAASTNLLKLHHVTPLFNTLQWLPISLWVKAKNPYKGLYTPCTLTPFCFFDLISLYFWTHDSLHSSHPDVLATPCTHQWSLYLGIGSFFLECTFFQYSHGFVPIYVCLMRFNLVAFLPSDFSFFHSYLISSLTQYAQFAYLLCLLPVSPFIPCFYVQFITHKFIHFQNSKIIEIYI